MSDYRERSRIQCLEWAQGHPKHNPVDNECTPDFSCCHPEMLVRSEEERMAIYHKLYGRLN